VYVAARGWDQKTVEIHQVNIATGKMDSWRTFGQEAAAGVLHTNAPLFSSDGAAYAYLYIQALSQAYVVTGMK
jgi:hypothetical protein